MMLSRCVWYEVDTLYEVGRSNNVQNVIHAKMSKASDLSHMILLPAVFFNDGKFPSETSSAK